MRKFADHSIPTRHSLLERLKNWRDDSSWREFFENYWELLYSFSRKAGLSDAEAQEAVQETVIAVAKNIAGFKADPARGSFKAWLLRQARWRIADEFEKRKIDSQHNARLSSPDAAKLESRPLEELQALWEHEWQNHVARVALERVKGQVSAKQFQMFDLHVLQGLSVAETARTLQTTVAAVYMAKSRISFLLKRKHAALSTTL
jgi:RNA polymerase sigma-70 factor (ECF subfamily)